MDLVCCRFLEKSHVWKIINNLKNFYGKMAVDFIKVVPRIELRRFRVLIKFEQKLEKSNSGVGFGKHSEILELFSKICLSHSIED